MAIKVNGTTVINDSRQLQNVASVDATTKTAIEAAGVGGRTTLVADNVSTGATGSGVTIGPFTLGDYRRQTFLFSKIRPNLNGWSGRLQVRLSNSSGTMITGNNNYPYMSSSGTTDYHETGDNRYIVWGLEPSGGTASDHIDIRFEFTNAYESSLATQCSWFVSGKDTQNVSSGAGFGIGGMLTIERNQSFIIYYENGGGAMQAGSTYSSWGVN